MFSPDPPRHSFGTLLGGQVRAVGFALVGYMSFVNLLGRVLGHSTTLATIYIALSLAATFMLARRKPAEMSVVPLTSSWRSWIGPVLITFVS